LGISKSQGKIRETEKKNNGGVPKKEPIRNGDAGS